MNAVLHVCPVADTAYRGACPVKKCHGNVQNTGKAKITQLSKSGCVYQTVGKKPNDELTISDISYALNLAPRYIKTEVKNETQTMGGIVTLYRALALAEEPTMVCSNCGVKRKSTGDCFNHTECVKRRKLVKSILASNMPIKKALKLKRKHFWMLWNERTRLSASGHNIDFAEIFNLTEKQRLRLSHVRSIV